MRFICRKDTKGFLHVFGSATNNVEIKPDVQESLGAAVVSDHVTLEGRIDQVPGWVVVVARGVYYVVVPTVIRRQVYLRDENENNPVSPVREISQCKALPFNTRPRGIWSQRNVALVAGRTEKRHHSPKEPNTANICGRGQPPWNPNHTSCFC